MSTKHDLQVQPSLSLYKGVWDEVSAKHLLRRTLFGAKKSEIKSFVDLGMTKSIQKLLDASEAFPNPPVKEYNPANATVADTNILAGQTWVNDPATDGTVMSLRRASFKKWWIGNLVSQGTSLREKMTLFWHNHFSIEAADVSNSQYIYKHFNLLRTNALGNVKTLVTAICTDPAMLVYLNGQSNRKGAADENFAREIQELFVIGKGVGAKYTESDVKEAARLFTGWRNNASQINSYFDIDRHDTGNKQFSSFYNNKLISGRNNSTAGIDEINDFINMLFDTSEAALFLCRKLYIWFVYYDITPEIESGIIVPMAKILRDNNYNIKPVLSALLSSEHFFDEMNRGCQIKSPVDLIVGMSREFEISFSSPDNYTVNYGLWNQLVNYCNFLQQNIGDPPDVSGWKPYYQTPSFYEYWLNSDTLPKRLQYTTNLISNGYTFSGFKMIVDVLSYTRKVTSPRDPNKLIEEISIHLLGLPISLQHRDQLKKDILLTGQSDDYYWSNAWDTYIASPANESNTKYVKNALTLLIRYMIELPEYQLS
jgi:uncharacterized protein (DUF1800 family)